MAKYIVHYGQIFCEYSKYQNLYTFEQLYAEKKLQAILKSVKRVEKYFDNKTLSRVPNAGVLTIKIYLNSSNQ